MVPFLAVVGVNIYLGQSSNYKEFVTYQVLTDILQCIIVMLLAYALYKLRLNVKKLEARNIFPNESLMVTFLTSETLILFAHLMQTATNSMLLPSETAAQEEEYIFYSNLIFSLMLLGFFVSAICRSVLILGYGTVDSHAR